MDPSDLRLPAFLDPVLDSLAEYLPPHLYSVLVSFLSHALALFTAFVSLVSQLISSKPWEWDAQTIIPPLISFLAAYLALLSLYRTTSWMFRTTFWFIKWGTVFATLTAAAGWYMGNQNVGGGGRGIVSSLGSVLLDILNGDNQNGVDTQSRSHSSRVHPQRNRPKAWEPWDKHQQWQYEEQRQDGEREPQQIMSDIVAAANRILVNGGWWDTAKKIFDGNGADERAQGTSRAREGKKRRTKSR
ncbi:hypothetical protein F5I97DRAFT_1803010 [Phlebopus sp. FC_14]|nr:hypothetical protein F5I97DRAFT_1803010 [Phlebopus sp. FC_14]